MLWLYMYVKKLLFPWMLVVTNIFWICRFKKISNSCRNIFCCNNYSRLRNFLQKYVFRFKLTSHYKLLSLKRSCTISDNDSQGRLIDTDKWDNHNTIARGWAGSRAEDRIDLGGSEDHYQPVTFRKLYGTKSVAGPSSTPLPMSSKPVVSEQETYSPNDEGYADLWSFRILKKT